MTDRTRLSCPECSRSFGRIEHLRRHVRSHGSDRPLKCSRCQKGFYRIDALHRHEQSHVQSALSKGIRACLPCAAGRAKCSGTIPCSRCLSRSLTCQYPGPKHSPAESVSAASSPSQALMPNPTMPAATAAPVNMEGVEENIAGEPTLSHTHQSSLAVSPSVAANIVMSAPNQAPSPNYDLGFTGSAINWVSMDYTDVFNPVSQSNTASSASAGGRATDLRLPIEVLNSPSEQSGLARTPSGSRAPDSTWSMSPPGQFGQRASSRLNVHRQSIPLDFGSGSPTAASQRSHSTGQYYLDGDGSRLPRVRKLKKSNQQQRIQDLLTPVSRLSRTGNQPLGFPMLGRNYEDELNIPSLIDAQTYAVIFERFQLTCGTPNGIFTPFQSTDFVSHEVLDHFVHLYLEFFQPILPFLHLPTLTSSRPPWLLCLAMAAIGSHYADIDCVDRCAVAFHELVRRCMIVTEECQQENFDNILIVQIKLLSAIGMLYCGDEKLASMAPKYHQDLVSFCRRSWLQAAAPFEQFTPWETWQAVETRRRTGYCIWLLDCMFDVHFGLKSILALEDAVVPLPCQELLWEADSSRVWEQLWECASEVPSLLTACQSLYVEKRLQWTMGEFSRILLIHALFHRTWEVETYVRQPLSRWTPTAQPHSHDRQLIQGSSWLPSIPTYTKWRNAACDCLDILHWSANSFIGAASGIEHPTVLHLHLSRVILLTPFRTIVNLACFTAGEPSALCSEAAVSRHRRQIERWATEDQHKARLAMIHAGVLFWHVRRYSAMGFYEPPSVFLASLALWAYGTFASPAVRTASGSDSPPTESDLSEHPTSMYLDRPADDELVQLFVRRGNHMRAKIAGVGHLCSKDGPARVLVEGSKLLEEVASWGWAREAYRVLVKLAEVCRAQQDGGDRSVDI
ncbi:hypothetical protein BDY21DRAFT_333575 [Lineolata rhizophorae]|uniref:Fungal-specific transcription factor domain-containing protein n=1 Tax=Lineolata rhizophorae TaxID=578093 RepID=A0A6A6PA25_9PEZI|nr:hypothetical protein BDY21DRAFT_333575 [Lineolata rhizophorae]